MKKNLFIILSLLFVSYTNSQVLYTENFDNHSVGNLGTNTTGAIPGQWGWLTYSQNIQANSFFTIVNETGRGKVLDISTGLTSAESFMAVKTNLSPQINNRNAGNEVLMFEIDYYTGSKQASNAAGNIGVINLVGNGSVVTHPLYLTSVVINKTNGEIRSSHFPYQDYYYYLPFNTWIKFVFYLDYTNRKAYFEIPYLNKVFANDFLKNETSTNLIQDFAINSILLRVGVNSDKNNPQIYTRNRYDNIKITALGAVPPEVINLGINEQLSAKFNMFPNPATNVVNITNSENMLVNKVVIYDIAGKQLSAQSFSNETKVQLNVETLVSGTYMLHIQSDSGTAIKKLIKK